MRAKSWTCAGLASDIPKAGDWFKYKLGHESIMVVRQRDQSIKAFYKVFKHRGRLLLAACCLLVDADFGHSTNLVCPFHSWSYGQDGKNNQVTSRE